MELEREINQFLALTPVVLHGDGMLERMRKLMRALGDPQNTLKIIHVAGTSGKTSTSYMVAALLQAAGKKVALTVSPHIDTVRERAMINLKPLSSADWNREMREFLDLVKKSGQCASYFEFYMAFAFWLAAKRRVDYMVVETGMGGRYDGSNVIERRDKIAVLTDIGLDHTEVLGDNLTQIADEKLGIVGVGNALLLNRQDEEVMQKVEEVAVKQDAELYILDASRDNFWERNFTLAKAAASLALKRESAPTLTEQQLDWGRNVYVPARAELVEYRGKEVILDGSHNPQKLQALVNYLKQTEDRTRVLVATLGANKAATASDSLRVMRTLADEIVVTGFKNDSLETHRRQSLPLDDLGSLARKAGFSRIFMETDARKAVDLACSLGFEQVVVTGSFYLLNELRPYLLSRDASA